MVTLVLVKNPFSPQDGREIKHIEAGNTLAELLQENAIDGVDLQATVNGYTVDGETKIHDGDFVVIYPVVAKGGKGGKGILGIIAAVALSVVSFGIASGGWLASSGFFAAGHLGAYMAAAAVMFLGSSLIGRMSGQNIDVGSYDAKNEPTYSWGGVQTMEGQNNAISLTYGKVKSGGQTIGKFVSAKDNDEYLNWLVAAGEGELSITDIRLNDNPISNYADVSCEIRTGTNDQAVIPYFNDTYFTKNLSYHMATENQWYTDTAQGMAEGLIFKIEFPNGLFHGNDDGGFSSNSVTVELQYKLKTSETWLGVGTFAISGDSNKAIRKEYRIDNIIPGEYDVRARVVNIAHDSATRDQKECYWTGITSIVYDDFTYPCQALIGIRAKATDQLNGTPQLTFMKERQKVWVYNPHIEAYEEQLSNNPAWACYDLLHQAREIKNINTDEMEIEVRGAAKELMRYDDFAEWADWCDDKEYYVNIEINTVGELLEIANQKLAPIGHGLVVRFGTRYGCIYNHVQTPVQMFGMGNIVSGSFSEEFLKVSDRANCVEITFTNKDAGYEREVITIYGDTYDSDGYAKVAQMTFDGITDYHQAYREGMYQLYSNKYLLRTVTFTAGIDSIACTVGDVVMISHDVPQWANSGRIYSIDGTTWVLPVELKDLTKSYRIQWRTVKDNLYTRACDIVSSADGWTTITVNGEIPVEDPPGVGDVFDIAFANVGSKPFMVKNITRSQEFERTISCIEYNENIFNENYDIPVIDYSQWYGEPKNVTGLVATLSQSKDTFGNNIGKLECSWNMPDNGGKFTILLSTDGENWTIGKTNVEGNTCELNVLPNTTYWVKVITVLGVNQSTGTQVGPVYPSGNGALPVVTNLTGNTIYRGVKNGEVRYEIHLIWETPLLANYQNCDVWYKKDNAVTADIPMTQGVPISQLGFQNNWQYAGQGYSDFTLSDVTTGDTYRFAVVTKDQLGNKNTIDLSPTVTVIATARTETPNTPNGFSIDYGNVVRLSWKEVSNTDIDYYEVRDDTIAGNEDSHLLARTSGTLTNVTLTTRSGTLYLFARSVIGKYSAPAKLIYAKDAPPTPEKPDVSTNLGSINIVAGAIPNSCLGMRVYINGDGIVSAFTENNTYTHSCEAGIYDVSVAYVDIFGEGLQSTASRVVIKKTIDAKLLEDEAVNIAKVDATIQAALQDAVNSAQDLIKVHGDINTVNERIADVQAQGEGLRNELIETNNSVTRTISQVNKNSADITQITQDVSSIQTTIENFHIDGDVGETVEYLQSQITQNANSINSTVSKLNSAPGASGQFFAISQLKQTADGLTSTVAQKADASTESAHYNALTSSINQQAGSITSIVTALGDYTDNTHQNFTAIAQLQDNIELKVSKQDPQHPNNDLISQINLSPGTIRLRGKLISIDGDTTVNAAGATAIVNMIQAKSIDANKLNVTSLSALTANFGEFTTSNSAGKVVISGTKIEVYSKSGSNYTLRVRLGIW